MPMNRTQSILSSVFGNTLEWYDFGLFAIFSSVFGNLFFPSELPHVTFMATLGVFAIGFICRPLGALVFGYMGDRLGRVKTLRFSILMISLPTFLIAFLPTYQQIGILAPILLVLTRMWQGFSIGGEYSGNIIYLVETAPANHRAFVSSFASVGANLGLLLAALMGFICTVIFSENLLQQVGWRLPYLIGGMLSLMIYFFRLSIKETHVFTLLKNQKQLALNPVREVFIKNQKHMLITLGLVCMGTSFYYFTFVYLPLILSYNMKISIKFVSMLMSCLLILMMVIAPLAGFMCDHVGRRKMLLFNSIFITAIIIPGFYLLQLNYLFILISVLLLFAIASSLEQGSTPAAIVENFPAETRYTGISFAYNLGNGLLGGMVPIVCEWLLSFTHFLLAPAFYITSFAILTGIVVYFSVK